MYGKMINEVFCIAPRRMTAEEAIAQGYKPVVLTEPPQTDENHYPVEAKIEETETQFIRHWRIEEFTGEVELSAEEALEILLGGAEQ